MYSYSFVMFLCSLFISACILKFCADILTIKLVDGICYINSDFMDISVLISSVSPLFLLYSPIPSDCCGSVQGYTFREASSECDLDHSPK